MNLTQVSKETSMKRNVIRCASVLSLAAMPLLLAGCGGFSADSGPRLVNVSGVNGQAIGGRQPISGASIYLYAASSSGYSAAATNVLTTPVTTTATGTFYISSFTCTAGQQMYIVSMGGDPGAGTNANAGIMAALGDCANLGQYSFININEITTVAAAFALAPFSSGYGTVGTSSTNTAGLSRAFASAGKLANVVTGFSVGTALPAGAVGPTSEVNSLANVLAACVNTTGGVSGDGSVCGKLFGYATPSGGSAPTDTIGAVMQIAQNPTLNVASIFNLASTVPPYSGGLLTAPNDWTMSINYAPSGLSSPKSTTIDANGNVWIANSGNNTVTVLKQTGATMTGSPFSSNGLSSPAAIAIDASGNAWVVNKGGTSVSAFTSSGGVFSGSPFTGSGNLSAPSSLAFDAGGDLWVANSTGNSVAELSSAGSFVTQITTGVTAPNAIVINPK